MLQRRDVLGISEHYLFHIVSKMTNDVSKKKGKSSSDKKAKRKTKRRETYAMYIYKVLKQVGDESARRALTASALQP